MTGIAQVLPRWSVRECHERATRAPAETLIRACREVTWREVPLLRRLTFGRFAGRRIDSARPVLDAFTSMGPYCVLAATADEVVIGLLLNARGAPQQTTSSRFAAAPVPGEVRIALGFRADGNSLVTETRVLATGPAALVRFYAYWAIIRVPSGLIRRQWLSAIISRAWASTLAGRPATRSEACSTRG